MAGRRSSQTPATQAQPGGSKRVPTPIDRILNVSIHQYDYKMCFDFIASVVSEAYAFEQEWFDEQVTGLALLSGGPQSVHSVLKSSFPTMGAHVRTKISTCVSNRVAEEVHKGGDFIPPNLAALWKASGAEIVPQTLFPPHSNCCS